MTAGLLIEWLDEGLCRDRRKSAEYKNVIGTRLIKIGDA